MAQLLKNVYSQDFFKFLSGILKKVAVDFDKDLFLAQVYDEEWANRALKQRIRHVSDVLRNHLSKNYKESVSQLLQMIVEAKVDKKAKDIYLLELGFMFIPDYIEQNGVDDFKTSVSAFEKITQFCSCEFAVRPFIIKYNQQMLDRMQIWASHKNEHVRRLASEGSRPRLPWAMALPELKKNPISILPILELLKSDRSEYVRRSVANSLNDISKDNPKVVIDIARKWKGQSAEIDWIVKHACRSLLKQGNTELLQLFGFGSVEAILIKNLSLLNSEIRVGEDLKFYFELQNKSKNTEKIRLEYGIYYQKKNTTLSRKVYKISEKDYKPDSATKIERKQSFKQISTRKFHAGLHKLSIIVNGVEKEEISFNLAAV